MTEIILLRHAEPESAGLYIGKGSNPELSPEGRTTAERISPLLTIEHPDFLYSSPLKRSVETIALISRTSSLDITTSEDLAEMGFGDWEGLNWKSIEQLNPGLWQSWLNDPWYNAPPGGETLKELQTRVIKALNEILSSHPDKKILVATHSGPLRAVLGYVLHLEPTAFWSAHIDYAGLCRFQQQPFGALDLLQWNVPLVSVDSGTDVI